MSASNYPNSSSVVLHVILLCFMSFLQPASALGNETDRLSLLKFKESIPGDPHGVLSSWNDSVHFCHWLGITCGLRHQRVTSLSLESYSLRGTISPHIGNLSFLMFFNLRNNNFSGEIPQQVGNLFRLKNLRLDTNALEGEIPVNLSYCSQLRYLNLGKNGLTGTIPLELGSLAKLEVLFLGSNNLTGGIPPLLANISSLIAVVLLKNNLVGTVPDALGRLKNLVEFRVAANNLSEYALGGQPSKQGDVYSYGILVLEIFTGRRPTDEMFKDDFNLHNFVKTALPERLVQIVDPALLSRVVEETPAIVEEGRNYNHHHHNNNNGGREIELEDGDINFENTNTISAHLQKCLVSVLEIGLACSQKSPNERMSIQDVTGALQHIKSAYMAAGLSKKRELPVRK